MKANELMVGDWLKHANGKYYRVTRIDVLGDYNSIHYACGFPHLWEYNNKFEPIPLTPEILEKNGFKRVIPSERTKVYLTHIKYVHELQHALRLCGIEKEIIL